MTKQNVVVPETITTASGTVAIPNSSPIFPYPPLRPRAALTYGFRKKHIRVDVTTAGEAKVNSWLESMRASSPTHARAATISADHSSWMKNHPSALRAFEEIIDASTGKKVVMFLDYDGTLSPIVDDPDRAFMSDSMRAVVRDVASCFPTAIVSGRCRDKVYGFVKLTELYYAGSHGMDIKAPTTKGSRFNREPNIIKFEPPVEFLPMIDDVYELLLEKTKSIPGCKVENNKFCVSVHFRCVEEKRWGAVAEKVKAVLMVYPKLHLCQGRKVLEIRPTIKWDKGKALEFLLESLGFGDRKDVLPVYIGDDRTDEDAFKVLRSRGQGVGILVSKIPKETNASYSLGEPSEVMDFLRRLVEWKRICPVTAI